MRKIGWFVLASIACGIVLASIAARISPRTPEDCTNSPVLTCGSFAYEGWPLRFRVTVPGGLIRVDQNLFLQIFFPGADPDGSFINYLGLWILIAGLILLPFCWAYSRHRNVAR
jgi:hypothetical protein